MYCSYWATRPETNFRPPTVVVKRLREVKKDHFAPCGFDTFRTVARQPADGYIQGSGMWTRKGKHLERFHPSICRLRHGKWIPENELATCIRRDRIRYIAIIGDSNGRGYFLTLHKLLSQTVARSQRRRVVCGPVTIHNGLNYSSYLSPQALVKHRCPCGGYCTVEFTLRDRFIHCHIFQARCIVDNVTDIVLEYITSWYTIDPKIQVRRDTHRRCQSASVHD